MIKGKPVFCRDLDVMAKCLQLRLARAIVVVIVQTRLAEPDYLGMAAQFPELV
jgi:hypothetical protein